MLEIKGVMRVYIFIILTVWLTLSLAANAGNDKVEGLFVEDIDTSLRNWSLDHPNDIAIGIKLGTAMTIPLDNIVVGFARVSRKECSWIEVKVIFERLSTPGTVFSLRYDGKVKRNILPSEIGPEVIKASQHLCTTNEVLDR